MPTKYVNKSSWETAEWSDGGKWDVRFPLDANEPTASQDQAYVGSYSLKCPAAGSPNVDKRTGMSSDTLVLDTRLYPVTLTGTSNLFVTYVGTTWEHVVRLWPDGHLEVDSNGGLFDQNTAAGVINAGAWNHLVFKVFCHATAGTYEIWANESKVLDVSGNTLAVTLDKAQVGNNGGSVVYWDKVSIANGLLTNPPVGALQAIGIL